MQWPLQDAKNRLSEVVKRARRDEPQTITLRGERAAIILSADAYDALVANRATLVDRLLWGAEWDDELAETVSARAKSPSRDVAF